MARSARSAKLETRSARLKLPIRKKPYFDAKLGRGLHLGYRRNQTAGTWVARVLDGGDWIKVIGIADDYEPADGTRALDLWQAQAKARVLGQSGSGDAEAARPITVSQALDRYEADLTTRRGDVGNVARVRG